MAMSELVKQETRNRIANITRRYKTKNLEHMMVRKATIITTAAIFGALNRMEVPLTVAGIPVKLIVAPAAMLVEGLSKGYLQAGAGGIADSTLAIYIERSISTDSIIAGEDDDDDDGDGDGDGDAEI